jgi:hypothetical protein
MQTVNEVYQENESSSSFISDVMRQVSDQGVWGEGIQPHAGVQGDGQGASLPFHPLRQTLESLQYPPCLLQKSFPVAFKVIA